MRGATGDHWHGQQDWWGERDGVLPGVCVALCACASACASPRARVRTRISLSTLVLSFLSCLSVIFLSSASLSGGGGGLRKRHGGAERAGVGCACSRRAHEGAACRRRRRPWQQRDCRGPPDTGRGTIPLVVPATAIPPPFRWQCPRSPGRRFHATPCALPCASQGEGGQRASRRRHCQAPCRCWRAS